MENLKPEINQEFLQEKINEAAQKGAIEAINEYYTGWNSPFRKSITEYLERQALDHSFNLPDILCLINEKLSDEINRIANQAIANSFLPMVSSILIRAEKVIKFSEILTKAVSVFYNNAFGDFDPDDCELDMDSSSSSSFKYLTISYVDLEYRIGFFNNGKYSESKEDIWSIHHLPNQSKGTEYMEIKAKDYDIKMPITRNVLDDDFLRYLAPFVINNTRIIFDVDDFQEDMFPPRCEC